MTRLQLGDTFLESDEKLKFIESIGNKLRLRDLA